MSLRVFLASSCLAAATPVQDPEEFPDLLSGSLTDGSKFSTGNALPLVGRPWGFNHFCTQTNDGKNSWWFSGISHEFRWIRLTHQPSPWIGDWGWLLFGPQMGGRVDEPVMFWQPWGARMKPHIFDAVLGPDNMRVQLSPTDHGAVLKVTFPKFNPQNHPKRICFRLPPPDKGRKPGRMDRSNPEEMFIEMTSNRALEVPANFGLYLRAQVDVKSLAMLNKMPMHTRISKSPTMHCFEFHHQETAVTVWIGTSLISAEMALSGMNREVNGRPFEDVYQESKLVWRELMSRIEIADPGPMNAEVFSRLTIFYTGLWRALSFPRRLDEKNEKGKIVHYSPYDKAGGTYPGVLVTDNGFWDTFRSVYTLLAMVYPVEAGEIISGWINAYKEGGWLPEWSSPSYRTCMVGTYADVVVSDAIIKDLKGFDSKEAWKAIYKDSYEPGGRKGQGGKANYADYSKLGYIPSENADSVSGTLDFAFSDYSVSMAAQKLGKRSEASGLEKRALQARAHLFDKKAGLMRPKARNGFLSFPSPLQWGSGYIEGSAWHHSFPPFDVLGLAALHGSRDNLARRIEEMVVTPGTFQPGSYKLIIHEMEEMRALAFGQYAHNNQPVHHVPFLLPALDEKKPQCVRAAQLQQHEADIMCPKLESENLVHEIMKRAYGIEFYSGDEDNGEMGAWYVLAALGLFEPAPGTHHGYALGSPLFRHVNLYRMQRVPGKEDSQPSLSILSDEAGVSEARHVTQVLLDGKDISLPASDSQVGWVVSYETLFVDTRPGATLRFVTGSEELTDGAGAGPAGQENSVLTRLQRSLQNQQAGGSNLLVNSRPIPVAAQATAEGRSSLQANQITQLENQLRRQVEENRRKGVDFDMSAGLASTVYMAFGVLVLVNGLGWLLCILQQRGGRKLRSRTMPTNKFAARNQSLPLQREPGQDV